MNERCSKLRQYITSLSDLLLLNGVMGGVYTICTCIHRVLYFKGAVQGVTLSIKN